MYHLRVQTKALPFTTVFEYSYSYFGLLVSFLSGTANVNNVLMHLPIPVAPSVFEGKPEIVAFAFSITLILSKSS